MTFEEALVPFQKDMEARRGVDITAQIYMYNIYTHIINPKFPKIYHDSNVWAPEVYLMTHYKTEFTSWLKLQI